jgi:hypothetical protein
MLPETDNIVILTLEIKRQFATDFADSRRSGTDLGSFHSIKLPFAINFNLRNLWLILLLDAYWLIR